MAALRTLEYLRRHAVPADRISELPIDHAYRCAAARPDPASRPRLMATWHPGPHGRPVCRWSIESVPPSG